ncbi:hypothetical protein [Streptomyces sp. NPDC002067]
MTGKRIVNDAKPERIRLLATDSAIRQVPHGVRRKRCLIRARRFLQHLAL